MEKIRPAFADPRGSVMTDQYGYEILVVKSGAPTNGKANYQKGCLYLRTDGTAGATLYSNQGTTSSTTWIAII